MKAHTTKKSHNGSINSREEVGSNSFLQQSHTFVISAAFSRTSWTKRQPDIRLMMMAWLSAVTILAVTTASTS